MRETEDERQRKRAKCQRRGCPVRVHTRACEMTSRCVGAEDRSTAADGSSVKHAAMDDTLDI